MATREQGKRFGAVVTLGHPKPEAKPKAPKPLRRKTWLRPKPPIHPKGERVKSRQTRNLTPLKRRGPIVRKKRMLASRYLHPEVRRQNARVLRRAKHRCALRHPGCLGRATQIHHAAYARGRGWRRLIVDDQYLIPCCRECHQVEDPWIGKGFGRGSREKNERAARD